MSLSELLLNNRFVPILQEDILSEYSVRKVSFASLVEFRSKMGFKFRSVEYQTPSKTELLSFVNEPAGEKYIKSIQYQYQVDQHIYITCTLSIEPPPST